MVNLSKVTSALICLLLTINAGIVHANKFLEAAHFEKKFEFEHTILSELEDVLGNGHRTFTEKRLEAIKKVIQPIYSALPKNEKGKLGGAATSYALYRVFLARHAWFVIGLEPLKAMASWDTSSAIVLLDQRVPDFITGLFNTRLGTTGFGIHELSVLAATLEHLVHKESMLRSSAAYRSLARTMEDVLGAEGGRQSWTPTCRFFSSTNMWATCLQFQLN